MTSTRREAHSQHCEICISSLGYQTEPHTLLTYFEQFGSINHYTFTVPGGGGGLVFISYENEKSVDRCMASRPHRLDGRHIYVKRALQFNSECPREHIDSTRDIIIITESLDVNEEFLQELREYFSSYGPVYACKYCQETNFNYILVEFADFDQVDRILLDKPHFFNNQQLNIMKCISSNKELMNIKYSIKDDTNILKDAVDVECDNEKFLKYELNYKKSLSEKTSLKHISEIDLENEVYRLENILKKLSQDFTVKKKQLEDDCCEQLRIINENSDQTHRLQQDLEQEHAKLLTEYQSLKSEYDLLNEQYLASELENFEITSYYEQILAEEKVKTARYENQYTEKLQILYENNSSPTLPPIPNDDDE